MSYSKHGFIGRLTKDPEVRDVKINGEDTKVANFTVAVDGEGKNAESDFYDVVAWRGLAANVERFLGKGRLVFVEGRPRKRSYKKDINGQEVTFYVTEIIASTVQFLDKPAEGTQAPQTQYAAPQQQQQQYQYQGAGNDGAPF